MQWYVSTQFNKVVKIFCSDNAKELVFTDFFFHKQGTVHQFLCVETPQQNSVVERKHQHILNVALALYFQSRIRIELWSDYVLTTVFLINRTPTPVLQGDISPYQKLLDKSSDYGSLRIFGYLAFASTLQGHHTKFEPRARRYVFIGYPPGVKGYKMFDLENKEVFVSSR